jgi:hypothetical protein
MKVIINEEQLKRLIVEFTTKYDATDYFYEQLMKFSDEVKKMKSKEDITMFVYRFIGKTLLDIATDYFHLSKGEEMDMVKKNLSGYLLMFGNEDNNGGYMTGYKSTEIGVFTNWFCKVLHPTWGNDYYLLEVGDYNSVGKALQSFFRRVESDLEELTPGKKKKEVEKTYYDYSEFPKPELDKFEDDSLEEKLYMLNRMLYKVERLMKDEFYSGNYTISVIDIEDGIEKIRNYYEMNDFKDVIGESALKKLIRNINGLNSEFVKILEKVI